MKGMLLKAIDFKDVVFSYEKPQGPRDAGHAAPESDMDIRPVLDHVDFSIEKGSYIALMGDNGSGKSTVARICDGFLRPDSGTATVLGQDISKLDEKALLALRMKVAMVFQDPSDQFVASRILDEVSFGPCNLGLGRDEVILRAGEALDAVGMTAFLNRSVNSLSGGERQRIAIADALAMRPEILILDEPTSMLDPQGRESVLGIINTLHSEGMTIVLITHDRDEALRADSVLRIHDGKVEHVDPCDLRAEDGASRSAGACTSVRSRELKEAEPVISFRDVSFAYDQSKDPIARIMGAPPRQTHVFSDLSFEIMRGESVAVMGPNGSGKSTALRLMNGLLAPSSGVVEVNGVSTTDKEGRSHARDTVGLCMQFPERAVFARTVYDEVAFGLRNRSESDAEKERLVSDAMAKMGLDLEDYRERNPFTLSGGLLRRISIASVLAMQPTVLALDEPGAGLDGPSRNALLSTLAELRDGGTTIVLVTHSQRDADIIADRVIRIDRDPLWPL